MNKVILFLAFSFCSLLVNAKVTLPKFFSDNMVLQRNVQIPIWGWANPSEKIKIQFHNQTKNVIADSKGNWSVKLDLEKAGGPFQLNISGENSIQIKNVLVGEVWLCSGQSNMEWLVRYSNNFKEEKKTANNLFIRYIKVEKNINSIVEKDISGGNWSVCDSTTVGDFSATAYFFAQKLYNELKIPIGLINSSWGGTNIETWISREGFESSDEFKEMIAKMPKIHIDSLNKENILKQVQKVEQIQTVKLKSFSEKEFKELSFDDSKLPILYQPKAWEQQSLGEFDGVVWIRKTIELTEEQSKKTAIIHLSKIDDGDVTYINNVKIGEMNQWDAERIYTIPIGVLKAGKNVIVVKVIDGGGGGGIWEKPENVRLDLENETISLAGDWKFQVESIKLEANQNQFPSLCYNAMIEPLIPFAFKGIIWYQGESNAERAFQYRKSFPLLIQDWRKKWNNEFPFYFVQLATFETKGNSNEGSDWAELREAQTLALSIPKTGMIVTTDIGNPKDIHPTNKQDVGKRLANLTLNNDYNKKRICKSPQYKSMKIKGNKVIVTFENVNSTLQMKNENGELKGFEIAGSDQKFYPAKAKTEKVNQVILESIEVPKPVSVRFGWKGDDSECNLFNAEGLSAVPFRTDNWKSVTIDKKYTFLMK
ncbi:sialate O-acetylesterase [Flavobacterium sp. ZS1P14]|uniref:sialate O-acetylesterase n=1 Tax=Flavobacterium sp. ZS1P14 TaxID=3401729 RepID=UPI003AAE1FCC